MKKKDLFCVDSLKSITVSVKNIFQLFAVTKLNIIYYLIVSGETLTGTAMRRRPFLIHTKCMFLNVIVTLSFELW